MSDTAAPFRVHALVRHELELPPLQGAMHVLATHMSAALGQPWPISLSCGPPELVPAPPLDLVLVSLLHEALPPYAPMPEVTARWHQALEAFAPLGAPLLLCNVFRHVPPQPFGPEAPSREVILDRVRRLNLLAIELSHRHALDLADIDRGLAYLGARPLQTGFLLRGGKGIQMAADIIAGAALQGDFPPGIPFSAIQAAQASHGGQAGMMARLRHLVQLDRDAGGADAPR
jgi:hypothetical protein